MTSSTDISQDFEEVDDGYDDQIEQEQFDVGDEDVIDNDLDGEGGIEEEDEKQSGQEGLDLNMCEEDGNAYQDELDDQDECEGIRYQEQPYNQNNLCARDELESHIQEGHSEGTDYKVCDGDRHMKTGNNDEGTLEGENGLVPSSERASQGEGRHEDSNDNPLSLPEHGSEVFVGNISKDTVEADLMELCAHCGDVFEVRVMRDKDKPDNCNKGFAFVTFSNKEIAQKAIQTLNECEFKGRKLRFSPSQLKNKLFIGNIPHSWGKEELQKVLSEKAMGIQTIELLKDLQNPDRNRGFAFVEYYNNACAENAKRIMSLPGFKLGTNTPTVNWADSPSASDKTFSQVKVVHVRNLPEKVTHEQLWKLFEKHGDITKVMLPPSKPGQPKRDFGFVHFAERSSAQKAIAETERYVLEGRELQASLAKSTAEKKTVPIAMTSPFSAGILPPVYQSRASFGFSSAPIASGFGSNRGQGQPMIYGRGPTPAGMTVVPMVLPDGRVGYVLQQVNEDSQTTPHRDSEGSGHSRSSHRHSHRHNSGSGYEHSRHSEQDSSGRGHSQHSQRHSGDGGGGSSSRRYRPY